MPCMVVHAWPCCCCAPAPKRGRSDRSASESRGETTGERHDATAGAPRQIGWACARVGLARAIGDDGGHSAARHVTGRSSGDKSPAPFSACFPAHDPRPRPRRPAGRTTPRMHGRARGSCHAVDFGPPPPANQPRPSVMRPYLAWLPTCTVLPLDHFTRLIT